ncbi:F-box/FBD/LRR-repeat protein At1g16930-like isoform X3 [Gastrolobium bilobum]|uniref:F-box/FBD/LRR-repeat protein At1g16930-like isoform X3 n=1 Tax=Gastrolobium bilobum TaxID=150636 RepID=UPI002AAF4967|nr:F-box/FBD/LRR-repeat protein At1g16930-like isoform X3 [Gastrolobium bilobum]
MMKMKRQREEDRDRDSLSNLPDEVLLHIMKSISIKDAVQTCVLSKRWKDLWKDLTFLNFDKTIGFDDSIFNMFVSSVLSNRHHSTSIHRLDFITGRHRCIGSELFNSVMSYAVLHNVQQLTICMQSNLVFEPIWFSCRSLTSLKVSLTNYTQRVVVPKYLQLPALKILHLDLAVFTASDNDCADPFSTCNMLTTLFIRSFRLDDDVKILRISNSNLSSLTIGHHLSGPPPYQIEIATPNVKSLTIIGFRRHSTTTDAGLDVRTDSVIVNWLHVLANVKIMTITSSTISTLLNDLSKSGSTRTQPPCFARLEALKVKKLPSLPSLKKLLVEEVDAILEYILQNSPLARVEFIR